jgi:hypothetical protein
MCVYLVHVECRPPGSAGDARAGGVVCSGRWHDGKITGMKMRESHKKMNML